nr:uncharacterized protein LOC112210373 [Halyomorpha halys]
MRVVIYNTIVSQVVIYGAETWPLPRKTGQMLKSWERKALRRIWGGVSENGVWRRGRNEELINLYEEPSIVALIKRARLRWLGHVERMPDERIPKKMVNGKEDVPGSDGWTMWRRILSLLSSSDGRRKQETVDWLTVVEEVLVDNVLS